MPHSYNTRSNTPGSSSVSLDIYEDVLSVLIENCAFTTMAEAGNQSASNSQVADVSEEEPSRNHPSGAIPKKPKAKKPVKVSNASIAKSLNDINKRLDDFDKRLERNELASGISLRTAPSAHSSPKPHRRSSRTLADTSRPLPSPEELRTNSRTQREVERRMRAFQNVSRSDESGMLPSKPVKSGRYRLGDQRVLHLIHWPQEFVSLGEDLDMPSYKELTSFQWTQGYALSIFRERDPKVRDVMLLHLASLMQDAEELNWRTSKRAHAGVLMDMERGYLHWRDLDAVDRARRRFTQRALRSQKHDSQDQPDVRICKKFNQGKCHVREDVSEHRVDHITYKHACSRCYKATKKYLPHTEFQCTRPRRPTTGAGEKSQV